MAISLGNRAKMSTSTTGTGTITLGSALSGYQTFAQAGITNGQTVRYAINDGAAFEIGSGTYTSSGTTLTRSVTESSNSDSAITLSGSAEVFVTATVADLFINDGASNLTTTGVGTFASLDISGDVDVDGTLEADAITVNGTALATVIAGTTVTNATNSAHVLVTDNESTNEENLIAFVEGATSSTGNVGLEMDGNFAYNPSTGTVSATVFKGNIDAVDGDFDGTLEADAITLNGTAVTATATLDTGISNNNVPKFTSGVADNDFLRVDGTAIEGRSASEVLSDIAAAPAAGSSNIVTTGALNSGSITSGFGAINNGSSNITTTGVGTFASLDISGDIDVDGTTNLDAVDIDGAVQLDATLTVGVDDTGYDVKFFGDAASAFMQWDASADDLILGGAAGLIVPEGQFTLGSTAVTSTGAELNILDGVTSNATEINILDAITRGSIVYGNSSGATARLAAGDADQVLTSDGTDISWADAGGGGTTIPSGTLMLFNQTAAPTGFTKVTTHNDKALRITDGTVGTGGSVAFETAFASQAVSVAATTISTSTMPSHNHSYNLYGLIPAVTNKIGSSGAGYGATNTVTSTGSGGSHTHTGTAIDLDVAYVDVIIASKD
jgi:cytoskeletal protein CcmA (bactofilin family)